jgi:hypothetical protein
MAQYAVLSSPRHSAHLAPRAKLTPPRGHTKVPTIGCEQAGGALAVRITMGLRGPGVEAGGEEKLGLHHDDHTARGAVCVWRCVTPRAALATATAGVAAGAGVRDRRHTRPSTRVTSPWAVPVTVRLGQTVRAGGNVGHPGHLSVRVDERGRRTSRLDRPSPRGRTADRSAKAATARAAVPWRPRRLRRVR